MVTEVVKYETNDGSMFDTIEEAIAYEDESTLIDVLTYDLYNQTCTNSGQSKEVAEYLVRNYNITKKQ